MANRRIPKCKNGKMENAILGDDHKDENGNPEPFIPEDHICKVGCPAKGCDWVKHRVLPWTQENPVKCACWLLKDGKTMEDYVRDYKISMPATELAELL